jgi:hypothetical protein
MVVMKMRTLGSPDCQPASTHFPWGFRGTKKENSQVVREQDSKEVYQKTSYKEKFHQFHQLPDAQQRTGNLDSQIRNVRKHRRVIGCELSRQLSDPAGWF